MIPTDRYPWTYRDKPSSGGIVRPRDQQTANHPTHKGRIYLVGVGWYWLAGWQQADGSIRLALDAMTPGHVDEYCRPRAQPGAAPGAAPGNDAAAPRPARPAPAPLALALAHPPADAHAGAPRGTRETADGAPSFSHTSMPYANRGRKPAKVLGEGLSEEDFNDEIPF